MPRRQSGKRCQVTGKHTVSGKSYSIRGISKKKKGIGLNTTGIVIRRFQPNIQKKRYWLAEEKRFITLKVSVDAMRTIEKRGLSTVVRELRAKGQKV